MKYLIKCFLLIVLLQQVIESESGPNERKLLEDLLDLYNILERPTEIESDAITVRFGATIISLINVCPTYGFLETNIWLSMEWVDSNLRWNVSEYGNISDIRMPPHRIWKPDILPYNSVDSSFDSTFPTLTVVKHDGNVSYIPPGIFKTTCAFKDFTWFPFDEHKCDIKFGSWVHGGDALDLELQDESGGDISSLVQNPHWDLIGMPATKNTIFYACCPEPYVSIVFTLHMKRKGSAYFVRDTIVSIFISSGIIIGFLLSAESGQKLTIGLVNLIASVVYLLYLAISMPLPFGASPRILQYLQLQLCLVFASLIANIIVVKFNKRNPEIHPVPQWINELFIEKIAPLLGISQPSLAHTHSLQAGQNNLQSPIEASASVSGSDDVRELLLSEFQVLKTTLTKIQTTNEDVMNDWNVAAHIIERVFLVVFAALILLFYICFFISFV